MAKILTIDDCLINNKTDEEQRLILESSLNNIKDDAKTANPDNYEEKRFNEKCLNYIDKMKDVYLKLLNLGDNEKKKINIFKKYLTEENKFYQISRNKIVPYSKEKIHWSNEEIKFYMTQEHKAKYLEVLTEKLKEYNLIIRNNNRNLSYRSNGKPFLKIKKIKDFARDAFNDSFSMAEDSYKQKLGEHNKKQDLKRSKKKVMRRTSREYTPGVEPELEEVLPTEEDLKELPSYSSKGIIEKFEAKKTEIDY